MDDVDWTKKKSDDASEKARSSMTRVVRFRPRVPLKVTGSSPVTACRRMRTSHTSLRRQSRPIIGRRRCRRVAVPRAHSPWTCCQDHPGCPLFILIPPVRDPHSQSRVPPSPRGCVFRCLRDCLVHVLGTQMVVELMSCESDILSLGTRLCWRRGWPPAFLKIPSADMISSVASVSRASSKLAVTEESCTNVWLPASAREHH